MVGAQRHRGPDDEGLYLDPSKIAGLGHNRLSIIDLSPAGRQVAAHTGYLPAEKLVEWLRKHHDRAAANPADDLTAEGVPGAAAVPPFFIASHSSQE